jgi:hypothetical protein
MRGNQNRRRREADQAVLGAAGPVQRQHRWDWFEQIQPHPTPARAAPAAGGEPQPDALVQVLAPRPLRAWLLSALAAMLAVGMVLGFALGSVRLGEPTSAPATRAPADRAGSPPRASVVVRAVASSACLETARRGDQLIQLFTSNQRSRAADLLVAYTVASRQCRRDASP